jgi:TRAP-type C4-dicarboxylate transport system permease small subunit
MHRLERISSILNRGMGILAGIALVAMMLLTVAEMVSRIFGKPMAGTVEAIGWLAAVTTAFALGYTQIYQGHVAIDIMSRKFSPRLGDAVAGVVYLASTALFALVTWQVLRYAGVLKNSGSLSETMKVIVYPWVYLVSLGCAGLTLALFVDMLKSAARLGAGKSIKKACPGTGPKG